MPEPIGHEADICHFCGGPEAGYARREDGAGPNSQFFDACWNCVIKPYPQPKQFQKKDGPQNEQGTA